MKKIFLSFFILILLFSCKKTSLESDIKIFVPDSISSIPILELNNKKIGNSIIQTNIFQDHILTMAEFINGKFPILMTGFSQGLSNYENNKETIQLATIVWGVSSLVTNDENIKTINDFKNKKIIVPFAKSPLELQLDAILKNEDLFGKIQIEYAPIQQAIPMMISKKVSGICIPEPFASKLILEKQAKTVFLFSDKWKSLNKNDPRSPQVSLFVKKEFAVKNKKFLLAFLAELSKAIQEINNKPEIFSEKYQSSFKLNEKIILSGIKNTVFDLPENKISIELTRNYLSLIDYSSGIDDGFFFDYTK